LHHGFRRLGDCGLQTNRLPGNRSDRRGNSHGILHVPILPSPFYEKWAASRHGLAMQPLHPGLTGSALRPQEAVIAIGGSAYRFVPDATAAFVEESGPKGIRRLPIQYAIGGKNTYYFLTPMERGRLQVLPIGYDIRKKSWYDVAASGVRMHVEVPAERPVAWTDPNFTFNTSCYGCHVSQFRTNYDLESDTYSSSWREAGINCETCHGGGAMHVELYRKAPGRKGQDMRIIRATQLTVQQRNEMCAPCHAKMSPISSGYQAAQRFFDHYDLVTLEDADYYPDGRDLGENYTYTSWLMSPCVRGGNLDCMHCHTSSGRYRFGAENPTAPVYLVMRTEWRTWRGIPGTRLTPRGATASTVICPRRASPIWTAATIPCCRQRRPPH